MSTSHTLSFVSATTPVISPEPSMIAVPRLVFLSNTGPKFKADAAGNPVLNENGNAIIESAAGGLGCAIAQALEKSPGDWTSGKSAPLGHNGITRILELNDGKNTNLNYVQSPDYDSHYTYQNKGPWQAAHWDKEHAKFDPAGREATKRFQQRVAQHVVATSNTVDLANQDDYQFMRVAMYARQEEARLERPATQRIRFSYFHHIPVPNQETMDYLKKHEPELAEALQEDFKALLHCDQIGFQTEESCHNFMKIVYGADVPLPKIGQYGEHMLEGLDGQPVHLVHMPISVPTPKLLDVVENETLSPYLKERLDRELTSPIVFYTGGERRDPSKRRVETLAEFEQLLDENPESVGQYQFLMVSIPTRTGIPAYDDYSANFLSKVETINQKFGNDTWNPIVLIQHGETPKAAVANKDCLLMHGLEDLERTPLVATMLTPQQEGLGLTALEGFVGMRKGMVALSESMGAAKFLDGLVESFDSYQPGAIKDCMKACIEKLSTPEGRAEARRQRDAAIEKLQEHDLAHWTAQRVCRLMTEQELELLPHLNPATPHAQPVIFTTDATDEIGFDGAPPPRLAAE